MSRIRTIKPDFWTSEQIMSCSPLGRLLFIGLWNFCDDNGVHPASYVRLKAEVFPADNCTVGDVKSWVGELITNELLREYVVGNKTYWIVTGWKNHQRIDKPTYRHPLSQSELKEIADCSSNSRGAFGDYSPTPPRLIDDSSITEWKGMEGKGEEDICEVKTSPHVVSGNTFSANTSEIFTYWQNVMNHPRAVLDRKRQTKIMQALKLGYSVMDLKQAIDGCAKTPFNMGENDRAQRYDDIELIFRDAAHIDRFISNAINPPPCVQKINATSNLMAGVI